MKFMTKEMFRYGIPSYTGPFRALDRGGRDYFKVRVLFGIRLVVWAHKRIGSSASKCWSGYLMNTTEDCCLCTTKLGIRCNASHSFYFSKLPKLSPTLVGCHLAIILYQACGVQSNFFSTATCRQMACSAFTISQIPVHYTTSKFEKQLQSVWYLLTKISHKRLHSVASPPPRPGVAVGPLGGARVICMRDIFILDEIWTQDNIYILVGTLLGWNILLIS
jgi:hypothetical protein